MPSPRVSIGGQIVSKDDAKISVYDHGLLYGDGVFEGMRIYSGKIFRLQEHLERLWLSARAIRLDIPISMDQMAEDCNKTVAAAGYEDGYVRLVITRGAGTLGIDPNRCEDPQVIIIVDKISLYPQEYYDNGLELITSSTIRNHPAAISPRVKSLNYLNNVLAKMEGAQAGCVEALMLNHKGEVAECTGDNIFIVSRGVVKTPPTDAGILEGITRQVVLELAASLGIPAEESTLTRHDLFIADECFLTGSAAEVVPVVKLDSRKIGDGKPGEITQKLIVAFKQHVRQ